jgi:hypothetical protein
MARLIIPEGSGAPRVRNFDTVTEYDENNEPIYSQDVDGMWAPHPC